MVKVTGTRLDYFKDGKRYLNVSCFADTKGEVGTAVIDGMPEGSVIAEGSILITANGESAFYKSDGTWNWVS